MNSIVDSIIEYSIIFASLAYTYFGFLMSNYILMTVFAKDIAWYLDILLGVVFATFMITVSVIVLIIDSCTSIFPFVV